MSGPLSGDMPPRFALSARYPLEGVCVVRAAGEVDRHTAPALATLLRDELTPACRLLVVDLADIEFMSSEGLAVLVEAQQLAGQAARPVLASPPHTVLARVVAISGLDVVLDLYPNVDQVVASSASNPPAPPRTS